MKQSSKAALPEVNPAWRIGIVAATFYKEEIDELVANAKVALTKAGIPESNIVLYPVAGSFEIPLIGSAIAKAKKADALLGFGIIVQGETKHADLLATETTRGIMSVQLEYSIPFAFEVLWVQNLEQAQARVSKGEEAAHAVLHSLAQLKRIQE